MHRRSVFVLLLFAALALRSPGQERSAQARSRTVGRAYGRSLVISSRGIVATSQVLASQAGADMLARGGSAVDAAIAANAVLSVMEPMMAGPGGDLFAIYRDGKTGKVSGLNASGWAPSGLTIDFLKQKGIREMPRSGIYSVTVPGCVDGWEKLHRKFGRLPWKDLFGPAIYVAGNGFPVPERLAYLWSLGITASCKDPVCRAALLPSGRAPKEGEMFRNPDLANALRILSEQGASAFYQGPIATPAHLRSARRHVCQVRPGAVQFAMGNTNLRRLSRVDGVRTAAQQPRYCSAGNVKPAAHVP
jgi:gamma-glutamyltranspeptidase